MTDPRGRHLTLRKADNEAREPDSMHHGGSFKKYMEFKQQKLREQYHGEQGEAQPLSKLFSGISIHVNGFTTPTHQELRQIMAAHGGTFEVYYTRQRVTHIICSNLPNAKIKALQKERTSTPIVRPEWIVESLKTGRVLPHNDYLLWRLRDKPGQSTLGGFEAQPVSRTSALVPYGAEGAVHKPAAMPLSASKPGKPVSPTAGPNFTKISNEEGMAEADLQHHEPAQQQEDRNVASHAERLSQPNALQNSTCSAPEDQHNFQADSGDANAWQAQEGVADRQGTLSGRGDLAFEQSEKDLMLPRKGTEHHQPVIRQYCLDAAQTSMVADDSRLLQTMADVGMDPEDTGWQSSGEHAPPIRHQEVEKQIPRSRDTSAPQGDYVKAQKVAAACRAACDLLKGAPKSSREDPKFMDNYYKSSRLHFIGTWKARIEALAMAAPSRVMAQSLSDKQAMGIKRIILHLDMDCFFASVAALTDPSLQGLPLAVCHSNSSHGTGEVSSANYLARASGVRADMGIGEAKSLCPDLIVMPYQYDRYQVISEQVYKILLQVTPLVQPISCDEAFLDVTGLGDPEALAAAVRGKILQATGCNASAGISHNMLLARLATKAAKPNGQYLLPKSQVDQHLMALDVSSLPGVGWSTRQKLHSMNIEVVADVRQQNEAELQKELGAKNGSAVWAAAHGLDDRQVEPMKLRRSVGAEVNWGIRFTCEADAENFLDGIAGEVQARMVEAGVKGRCISVKLKRRKSDAPEPYKFLGHGPCDNVSRSVTLNRFTDSLHDLASEAKTLLRAMKIPATQMRGIGISVSKLDNDQANLSAGSSRMALPRPAQPASVFKPRITPSDPYEDTGVSIHQAKANDTLIQKAETEARKLQQSRDACQSGIVAQEAARRMPPPAPIATSTLEPPVAAHAASLTPKPDILQPSVPISMSDSEMLRDATRPDKPGIAAAESDADAAQLSYLDTGVLSADVYLAHAQKNEERVNATAPLQDMAKMPADAMVRQAARMQRRPSGTPIQALPPASQLDTSVLDALPLQMKRELERAYGADLNRPAGIDRSKRRRGTGRPTGSQKPIRQHFLDAIYSGAPLQASANEGALALDLGVLKELPLDVQQDVADDLARANALATLKPVQQSSFVQFPAPDPEPERVLKAVDDPTETAKDVWPKFKAALISISESYPEGLDGPPMSGNDLAILQQLEEAIIDFSRSLTDINLECVLHMMNGLCKLRAQHPVLVPHVDQCLAGMQARVRDGYSGLELSL